ARRWAAERIAGRASGGSIASRPTRHGWTSWRRGSSASRSPASSWSISRSRPDGNALGARFLGLAALHHLDDGRRLLELVGDRLLVDGVVGAKHEAIVEQLLPRLFVVEVLRDLL